MSIIIIEYDAETNAYTASCEVNGASFSGDGQTTDEALINLEVILENAFGAKSEDEDA